MPLLNLKAEIVAALSKDNITCELFGNRIYSNIPQVKPIFPYITFQEIINQGAYHADNNRMAADIHYQLFIRQKKTESPDYLAAQVYRVLTVAGFICKLSRDQNSQEENVKTMIFATGRET